MERNKSDKADYAFAVSKGHQSPFSLPRKTQEDGSQMHDSVFMKYASSIIQVISQQKLEKCHLNQNSIDHVDPTVEISEVIRYGGDSKSPNMEYQLAQSNNYNTLAQHFKKKRLEKSPLTYNFTNLTTLATLLAKHCAKYMKTAFQIIKNIQAKKQQPVKIRTSFHSGTTASTCNDDFRSRRQLQTLKKIESAEQMKEGANAIKGWIQFKVLMIQSSTFKEIQDCQRQKHMAELSPIQGSSKKDGLIDNFYLSEYQQDNSISLAPNLRMEQSLAYTADQNFQFSRKEYTITTPEKLSRGERPLFSGQKSRVQSGNLLSEAKESQVQQYKHYLKKDSKSASRAISEFDKKTTSVSYPLQLNINEKRRYLTIRTSLFDLPFISQHDLRKNQQNKPSDLPLKNDFFSSSQAEFSCDNVQSIMKDFQSTTPVFRSSQASRPLTGSSSQKSIQNSYFTSLRDKYSKVMTEQSRASDQITQTCKIKSRTNITHNRVEEKHQIKINHHFTAETQQRRAPLKIQNYYFPGRESRDIQNTQKQIAENHEVMVEYPKNRLDEVKQVDSILSKHLRELPQKSSCRIEESVVSNFAVPEEPKIKAVKGTAFPIKMERSPAHIAEYSRLQEERERSNDPRPKDKPKISINLASNTRKIEHSPHNLHIQGLGGFQKKNQPVTSPRRSNPYSPSPQSNQPQYARPVQVVQQYGSTKRIQQPMRSDSRGGQVPVTRFDHGNAYQINQALHQQQRQQMSNAYNQDQRNCPQMIQKQGNRPVSRIYSPQPYPVQNQVQQPLAVPIQREQSSDKKIYFSPQIKQDHYYMQSPVRVNQQQITQPQPSHISKPTQEYFITDCQSRQQGKAVNFNNKYYTSGVVERQAPIMAERPVIMTERKPMRPFPEERRKSRVEQYDRPHSSSRQSLDRPNIFSIHSPMESQIQVTNGSNPWNSRNVSKVGRPKSMNEKIYLTLRVK